MSDAAERFIRTMTKKIYKYMTSISKNVYIDKIDDIVDEYNNTYNRTIKMKPIDVGDDSFAEYKEESNEKDPKFKVGDNVRISRYKNIFAKGYTPNWSEESFVVKKTNTVPWTYVISDLNGEGIVGSFYEKELQKTNQIASLKTEVDRLDIDKLTPDPNNLAKLSNVVKKDVVKKTEYNKLVTKVDNIDTTNLVKKTKYEKDRSDFEDKINKIDKKIPDVSGLVKKNDFNSKTTEIEGKIPSITGLATTSALTSVENKIPDVNGLIKKTDYDTKISEIEKKIIDHNHDKYITTPEFNTMAASTFNAKLAVQTDLIRKPEFDFKLKGIRD